MFFGLLAKPEAEAKISNVLGIKQSWNILALFMLLAAPAEISV